jgi:hypothetical protein
VGCKQEATRCTGRFSPCTAAQILLTRHSKKYGQRRDKTGSASISQREQKVRTGQKGRGKIAPSHTQGEQRAGIRKTKQNIRTWTETCRQKKQTKQAHNRTQGGTHKQSKQTTRQSCGENWEACAVDVFISLLLKEKYSRKNRRF